MTTLPPPPPDTKDWTWVLEKPCNDCGFDPASYERADFSARIDDAGRFWRSRLAEPDSRNRPAPQVWSPLEYACHVRDVFSIFDGRYRQMLAAVDDTPVQFDDWNQDEAAQAGDYAAQESDRVSTDLVAGADRVAALLRTVAGPDWDKAGLRSDASKFTVDTLTRYLLHDLIHHEWDVTR